MSGDDRDFSMSYANGIAWYLTEDVHPGYKYKTDNLQYTGLVQDIIDSDGTKVNNDNISEYVSGYSIKEVENAVYGAWTLIMWQNNLLRLYPNNPTEGYVPSLFELWM